MPFQDSVISGTQAHKHESASTTGGALDANAVTLFSNTTTGSLIYFDGSQAATNLNAGNLNDVLTMGASLPAWSAGGGSVTTNRLQITGASDGSTYTNTALGDVTGTSSVSLSNQAGGSAMIIWCYECECSSSSNIGIAIQVDGVDENFHKNEGHGANAIQVLTGAYATHATDGTTVQERLSVNAGTLTLYNGTAYGVSLTDIIEVY